jgi:2-polyprenyl-3-methyl-5-hydroxy-6-metoxy-1,4-benzoquinol methylase
MIDLSKRSTQTELMDLPETSPADYAAALADLAKVNCITLTHRPVLQWLDHATQNWPAGHRLSVLDVASGQGDLLRAIHAWGSKRGFKMDLRGIDMNARSAVEAAAATPPGVNITWQTGDVFAHIPNPAPDFIVTSQFAHHLDDAAVVALLRWLEKNAKRGWFIADLHRHIIPYFGFRLLCWAMLWHRIVRIDGTISIARSFREQEWWALAARAGVAAQVRWHWMFRLCVGRLK